ncbi:hypothetical protein [Modestobacter roseus]|uniref:hypothetical protein n=1 Tax=Modestobacter roseus TaxID=1181884 RepID=UPI0012969384|nr:hypothetical protein [Modestobacter roseus]MQA35302.1 hypothetical protein [Modestobacter roseus]
MTESRWRAPASDPVVGSGAFMHAAASHLLQLYLQRTGWTADPPGPAGALWRHGGDAAIAIPHDLTPTATEWRGVVERLARFERRAPRDVETSVEFHLTDVTRLRAANDIVIRGSIPLEAGVSLVSSAWSMLRASATTAVRPRGHIAGGFSRQADALVEQARLGHTQEGSYVIPVLMPLTPPAAEGAERPAVPGLELERLAHEPPERRVMRTFAQALAAVDRVIVAPERTPSAGDLQAAVVAGASREMVMALHRVLSDDAVSEFAAAFSWAGGVMAPAGVPSSVRLPAAAASRLQQAAQQLKASSYTPDEIVTGPIVEVRHEPENPFGEISVQTVRRGRQTEVRVRLRAEQLLETFDWARDGRSVVCEGRVRRMPGRPLMIDEPRRVQPLDETYLPTPPAAAGS